MTTTITCVATPDPEPTGRADTGALDPLRAEEVRQRVADLLLVDQVELADELTHRWFVVLDALTGVEGVPVAMLRADIYYLTEALRRLRSALPAQNGELL